MNIRMPVARVASLHNVSGPHYKNYPVVVAIEPPFEVIQRLKNIVVSEVNAHHRRYPNKLAYYEK